MFPVLEITDDIFVPTYVLIISLVYSGMLLWVWRRSIDKERSLKHALDACLAIMLGGFVGARLMHVFYENPQYYLNSPLAILKVWQGGFVFYGGAFGALAGSLVWLKLNQQRFAEWSDFFAPVFAGGYALGRLSCLFAGCCFGRPCDLPWSISYPPGVEAPPGVGVHPTPIYAALFEGLILLVLLHLEKGRAYLAKSRYFYFLSVPGGIFAIWVFFHAWGRALMEYFRADFRGPQLGTLSISSLLSFVIIILSAAWIYKTNKKKELTDASRTH